MVNESCFEKKKKKLPFARQYNATGIRNRKQYLSVSLLNKQF